MSFDSNDSDDNTPALTFTLPLRSINVSSFTFIVFTMFKVIRKKAYNKR
jgi:hypothetical protein